LDARIRLRPPKQRLDMNELSEIKKREGKRWRGEAAAQATHAEWPKPEPSLKEGVVKTDANATAKVAEPAKVEDEVAGEGGEEVEAKAGCDALVCK